MVWVKLRRDGLEFAAGFVDLSMTVMSTVVTWPFLTCTVSLLSGLEIRCLHCFQSQKYVQDQINDYHQAHFCVPEDGTRSVREWMAEWMLNRRRLELWDGIVTVS
jgi:hypothetical protein